jgi:RNA polymerase sigma-70 factor (ECF subfamily)
MPVRPLVRSVLSREEIEQAIRDFSTADWNRLHKVAQYLCRGRTLDPNDLLQEALTRAIDGSRTCPRNVAALRFLSEAMRSIASDTAEADRRQLEFRAVPLIDQDGTAIDVPDREPNPEERLIGLGEAKGMSAEILALFADDLIAQTIVLGIMEDMDGEELRALTELDKTAFASKRRLIRRRITNAFPRGRKP